MAISFPIGQARRDSTCLKAFLESQGGIPLGRLLSAESLTQRHWRKARKSEASQSLAAWRANDANRPYEPGVCGRLFGPIKKGCVLCAVRRMVDMPSRGMVMG
jgi:hypothetical protein